MSKLADIKSRGTEDILITATDNLNGFTDSIRNVFLGSKIQTCVLHLIRNTCRYLVWKRKKTFTADMIYINAPNQQAVKASRGDFAELWESKYSYALNSWRDNWEELTVFFEFPLG